MRRHETVKICLRTFFVFKKEKEAGEMAYG